jgi:hypothetical protein
MISKESSVGIVVVVKRGAAPPAGQLSDRQREKREIGLEFVSVDSYACSPAIANVLCYRERREIDRYRES